MVSLVPNHQERPFELFQIYGYSEIVLRRSGFVSWLKKVNESSKPISEEVPKGGRPPVEAWDKIDPWIETAIAQGNIWNSWEDLWVSIPNGLKKPETAGSGIRHETLRNHIRTKRGDLHQKISAMLSKKT